jgi:hypothetical protein
VLSILRKGLINLASMVTGDLPFANLTQGSALSVLGVAGNATADHASIAAGSDHQVFRRSGTAVGFGQVNLAQSAAVTGTLPLANGGIGATTLKAAGIPFALSTNYIDATGTAGVDNTAQTVKSINIDADMLTQVGDRIHLAILYRPDTGTAMNPTVTVNGVTVASVTTTSTDALFATIDVWLSYIDATHANVKAFWRAASGAVAQEVTNSGANIASFAWGSAQAVNVVQNAIANNHLVVHEIVGIVYPKAA